MKRISIMLALIITLLSTVYICASDITDANYYGVVRATNNSTLAEKVSANFSCNTTALIATGIVNSTVNNTAMRSGGSDIAFMPGYGTNPWIAYYASIPTNSSVDAILYTNVSGGELRYFPGATGMTTADDDTDLEPGANFTYQLSAYIDTMNGTDKILMSKLGVLDLFISPSVSGNITADLYMTSGWYQPTSTYDPDSSWYNDNDAIDGNTATNAGATVGGAGWTNYLEVISSIPIYCTEVRINVQENAYVSSASVDLYYSGAWHQIYSGNSHSDNTWYTIDNADVTVEKARLNLYAAYAGNCYFYDFSFGGSPVYTVTATGISSGNHTVMISIEDRI